MKNIFLNTHKKLTDSKLVEFVDRDRGQIDRYENRPSVKFPCALIKVNIPKSENLNPAIQRRNVTVQIRVAFERTKEQHNLQSQEILNDALRYYDSIEDIEKMFQGLKLGNTDRWVCTGIIDEDRTDFDVVRITFATTFMKEF
ncbi:hypothetical protein [Sphingobacterium sp. LRF_L2]|uniref:hypothetical protein n=1 Tax=Sphingobacterium sp. LRF_L2 TaxID=3369421 RepID=UPI003F5F8B77